MCSSDLRIIAVFQPHRYSRTRMLWDEFTRSFKLADYLILTDIYPASEKPLEGINASALSQSIRKNNPGKEVNFLAKEDIVSHLLEIIKPQDLIIILGAGDITKVCDELADRLKGQIQVV